MPLLHTYVMGPARFRRSADTTKIPIKRCSTKIKNKRIKDGFDFVGRRDEEWAKERFKGAI